MVMKGQNQECEGAEVYVPEVEGSVPWPCHLKAVISCPASPPYTNKIGFIEVYSCSSKTQKYKKQIDNIQKVKIPHNPAEIIR